MSQKANYITHLYLPGHAKSATNIADLNHSRQPSWEFLSPFAIKGRVGNQSYKHSCLGLLVNLF